MTAPIIQIPTLRPTDVVREPGLDPNEQSGQMSRLAQLLMLKGHLALQQQKQKKQTLDQLNTTLSGLFSQPDINTPQGLQRAMGGAIGPLAGAGETAGASAAMRDLPGLQQQAQGQATQNALGVLMRDYANAPNPLDPGNQSELILHAAAINPEAAFRISEGLKNLRPPADQWHPMLGNDGAIYGINERTGTARRLADTGAKNAPNQQTARINAAQVIQDITDMEAILARDKSAGNVPITAAMLEGAKAGGGFLGALAGGLEPLAKGQYTPNQLQFRRLKLNFLDHYAAAVIGRRAAGSPATMKLVMDGFFPAAGEADPEVLSQAAGIRARTKSLMRDWISGKTVDLSSLPQFAQLLSEGNPQGAGPTAVPAPAPSGPPITFDQLRQGIPR